MERDFCIADMFMPRKQLSLDPRTWRSLYDFVSLFVPLFSTTLHTYLKNNSLSQHFS